MLVYESSAKSFLHSFYLYWFDFDVVHLSQEQQHLGRTEESLKGSSELNSYHDIDAGVTSLTWELNTRLR